MKTRDAFGKFASPVWDEAFNDSDETVWSVVNSSNVAAVGYNAGKRVLGVTFNNGSSYQYFDVDESVFEGLRSAGSVGKYLHQVVKGHYSYQKVG
jgi:hypothetical protein